MYVCGGGKHRRRCGGLGGNQHGYWCEEGRCGQDMGMNGIGEGGMGMVGVVVGIGRVGMSVGGVKGDDMDATGMGVCMIMPGVGKDGVVGLGMVVKGVGINVGDLGESSMGVMGISVGIGVVNLVGVDVAWA